jgi:hypothetical protein
LTDPDSDHLKSAAEYLLQVARTSEGRRYRKQPKIDALRQYKEEILEAHSSGLSVHRIAQIFREQGVDISVPHLVRTVRRFVDEEERTSGRASGQRPPPTKETKSQATNQVAEQPSAVVREEEFAKQLRLARYLAGANLPPSRSLQQVPEVRTPKQERPGTKSTAKAKRETTSKKAQGEELAKERRRAGRPLHKVPSSGTGRGEKQRPSPGR